MSINVTARSVYAFALLAVMVSACGKDATTEPAVRDGLPVVWTSIVAPPGSFTGYACGLTVTGSAYCWGTTPGVGESHRPIAVPGGYSFVSISAGTFRACGLTLERRVVCWGRYFAINAAPQPPAFIDTLTFSALSVGIPYTCGLIEQQLYCHDHTVTTFWPHTDSVRFDAVASGHGAVCALAVDGAAWCWDALGDALRPRNEQVVRGPVAFRSLSVGDQRCAIAVDDATYCWGPPGERNAPTGGQVSVPVKGGHRFRSISVGVDYACGVTVNDDAWCWGSNHSAQFGSGEIRPTTTDTPVRVLGTERFASISAGWATTCAVTLDGAAYCWGDGKSGRVGDNRPPLISEVRFSPTRVANPLR